MTEKADMIDDDAPPSMAKTMFHVIWWSVLLSFALIASVVSVMWIARILQGDPPDDWWALPVALLVAGILSPLLWRWRPDFTMGEPMTPRGKRLRWFMVGLVVLGAVTAMPLILADGPDGERLSLFGNGSVPVWTALSMMALWLIGIPLLSAYGRRNADDFAKATGDWASMIGFAFFTLVTPVWWMDWRGGMLPEPDAMLIFIAALVVSTSANLWKRSHG